MKQQLLILTFISITLFAFSRPGELKYPTSEIPAELKENVDVVIREDHMIFKIFSRKKASLKVHLVATILNEKGNDYASHQVQYDKLLKVVDINGAVYDATGKQIKKLRNRDIYDRAAFDGVSLFSDNRVKILDLSQGTYPYTIEIEYELNFDYLLNIPSSAWGEEKVSYQNASYTLIYPAGQTPLYKCINIKNPEPQKQTDGSFEIMKWTLKNILPLQVEKFGPESSELASRIVAVPLEFEFSGYSGRRDSWENFGKWQIELNKNRDVLSEKTIAMVKNLTKNLKTDEEKARVLYEYLQSKTRYVGVQLGIGGFQPFEAKVVDEVGYGDCKALSNYMLAMLKVAGVKGYYTWIYGGKNPPPLIDGITFDLFNHIVVSVPNGKDTLWLECTSQTAPFGFQGTFTGDRKALMITENGGKIVNTLRYLPEQNRQVRTANVELDASGNALAKIKTVYSGIQYEVGGPRSVINVPDQQKKWIENNTGIPNFSINSFSITEQKDKIPFANVNLDLKLNRYATVSGKRMFVSPNLMNKISFVPEKIADRKHEVIRKNNYVDIDSIKFSIPENLYPEFLPEPIKINSRFGEYEANFKFDAGKVIYTRRMKAWKGRFPKETYNELVDFYKSISKADNIKLVFLNKT